MPEKLEGKVAGITGGKSGLGRATAGRFAAPSASRARAAPLQAARSTQEEVRALGARRWTAGFGSAGVAGLAWPWPAACASVADWTLSSNSVSHARPPAGVSLWPWT